MSVDSTNNVPRLSQASIPPAPSRRTAAGRAGNDAPSPGDDARGRAANRARSPSDDVDSYASSRAARPGDTGAFAGADGTRAAPQSEPAPSVDGSFTKPRTKRPGLRERLGQWLQMAGLYLAGSSTTKTLTTLALAVVASAKALFAAVAALVQSAWQAGRAQVQAGADHLRHGRDGAKAQAGGLVAELRRTLDNWLDQLAHRANDERARDERRAEQGLATRAKAWWLQQTAGAARWLRGRVA